jgi:hypothetical protein
MACALEERARARRSTASAVFIMTTFMCTNRATPRAGTGYWGSGREDPEKLCHPEPAKTAEGPHPQRERYTSYLGVISGA